MSLPGYIAERDKNEKSKKKIDRRSFLRSTAAAGAGLVLPTMASGQTGSAKKQDHINVALLGAGDQGQVLMNACVKIPGTGVQFKAVCDIWPYHRRQVSRLLTAYHHGHKTYLTIKRCSIKKRTSMPRGWPKAHL